MLFRPGIGTNSGRGEHTYRLINAQDQTACLHCCLDRVNFYETRLPNEGFKIVSNTLILKVNTSPDVAFSVLDPQPRQNVCCIEASIVTQLAWYHFKSFGKGLYDGLLFPWDILVGKFMEVGGNFHLRLNIRKNIAGWWKPHTSQAPPPATMLLFRIARLTIIMASCRLLSTSAMNCSAPPRNTKVQVLAAGQPSKKLNLSPPIWRSSNRSQVPRC